MLWCVRSFVRGARPAVAAAAVVVVAAGTTCVEAVAHRSTHRIIKALVDIVAAAVQPILNIYNLHITKHCLLSKGITDDII